MAKLVRVDRGTWANNTDYIPGDYAIDPDTSIVWNCAIMHTSPAMGPFSEFGPLGEIYWRVELQVIASADKYKYDGALTPLTPSEIIRGRYPWKMPAMKEGGSGVTDGQKEQRSRWKAIKNKFKNVDAATRARWWAARPQWHSLLWYYNYFMMSGLMGNAEINGTGGGVIKSIQHKTFTLPAGLPTNVTVAIDAVDPTKAICFFYGAGYFQGGPPEAPFAAAVYPYLVTLLSTYAVVEAPMENWDAAGCSVSVIEYI